MVKGRQSNAIGHASLGAVQGSKEIQTLAKKDRKYIKLGVTINHNQILSVTNAENRVFSMLQQMIT